MFNKMHLLRLSVCQLSVGTRMHHFHYLVFVVTQPRDGNEFNIEIDDTLAREQEQSRYLELQYSLCMEYKSVV